MAYNILQIDGGDIKGIIPAYICQEIERMTGKRIHQIFDLIIGSSTGAVIGGCLAAGVKADVVCDMYTSKVCNEFAHKIKKWYAPWTWSKPIYRRKVFLELLRHYLGDAKLSDTATDLVITAMGIRKGSTHFIKSTEAKDSIYSLVDAISWSALSAVWYFGGIAEPNYEWNAEYPDGTVSPEKGEVFQDGGQGLNSCTIMYGLVNILAELVNTESDIRLLSIGTGDYYKVKTMKDSMDDTQIRQVINFLPQAREESMPLQVGSGKYVAKNNQRIKFARVNCGLTKAQVEFGAQQYKEVFIQKAKEMVKQVPWEWYM